MYIFASDFFEKDNQYVFQAIKHSYCVEFLAFKYVFNVSFETNQMVIYFEHQKS